MNYRNLGKTKLKVSGVGLGTELLRGESVEYTKDIINYSINEGINLIDINDVDDNVFNGLGLEIRERNRGNIILQCGIEKGIGGEETFKNMLGALNTSYIDIGIFNHINSEEDFERIFKTPIIDKATALKKDGVIRYIGISSNCCKFSLKAVETGLIDVLTLNIDPKYNKERGRPCGGIKCREMDGKELYIEKLYNACERLGIVINIINSIDNEHLFYGEKCDVRKSLISLRHAMSTAIAGSTIMSCKTKDDVDDAIYYVNNNK